MAWLPDDLWRAVFSYQCAADRPSVGETLERGALVSLRDVHLPCCISHMRQWMPNLIHYLQHTILSGNVYLCCNEVSVLLPTKVDLIVEIAQSLEWNTLLAEPERQLKMEVTPEGFSFGPKQFLHSSNDSNQKILQDRVTKMISKVPRDANMDVGLEWFIPQNQASKLFSAANEKMSRRANLFSVVHTQPRMDLPFTYTGYNPVTQMWTMFYPVTQMWTMF